MRFLVVGAFLFLVACSKASDEAKRQYGMIERAGGQPGELCEASKKIADAYLKEGNEKDFRLYKSTSDAKCMLARLRGQV